MRIFKIVKIKIEHIDDVLPYVAPDTGIIVSKRKNFSVIDYVYAMEDTFSNPMTLQCRGLKFDMDGRIIARPFHKFFNIGEREQPHEIDWSRPHHILDKLDGSLIHPVMLDGKVVFMTRMGQTDQAMIAQNRASTEVMALCEAMLADGMTPMFEYTAPDNRIVVAYDKPEITLLAVRKIVEGAYLSYEALQELGRRFSVPIVRSHGQVEDYAAFLAAARALRGMEGYVIFFEEGHFLKLKADDYVLRHKAQANLVLEKNVLMLVVENQVDDVAPLLTAEMAAQLRAYQQAVFSGVEAIVRQVQDFHARYADVGRRDYAAIVMKEMDSRLRAAAFFCADGKDVREALINDLWKAAHSETRIEALRDLYGFSWDNRLLLGLSADA